MDKKIEIIVFSHITGKVESIYCDEYTINSTCNLGHVTAIVDGKNSNIIPWNRVKQINFK